MCVMGKVLLTYLTTVSMAQLPSRRFSFFEKLTRQFYCRARQDVCVGRREIRDIDTA